MAITKRETRHEMENKGRSRLCIILTCRGRSPRPIGKPMFDSAATRTQESPEVSYADECTCYKGNGGCVEVFDPNSWQCITGTPSRPPATAMHDSA